MKKTLASMVPDMLMVCGAAAIAVGTGMVYAPAGYIVGGCFLLVAGVLGAKAGGA